MDNINQHLETIRHLAIELKKVEELNEMANAYKDRASELENIASKLINSVDKCVSASKELLHENKSAIDSYKTNYLILQNKIETNFVSINKKIDSETDLITTNKEDLYKTIIRTGNELQSNLEGLKYTEEYSTKLNKIAIVLLSAILLIQIISIIYYLWIR